MNNYRPFAGITPAVKIIIIINVLVFLAVNMIGQRSDVDLVNILGMHLPQSQYFQIYQYITHMFTQEGLTHLFFNMFAVFMFGRILESVWGTKRFIIYYFVTGLGAAALHSLVSWYGLHNMQEQFYAFQSTPDAGVFAEFVRSHVSNPRLLSQLMQFVDAWNAAPASSQFVRTGRILHAKYYSGLYQRSDYRGIRGCLRHIAGIRYVVPEHRVILDVHSHSHQGEVLRAFVRCRRIVFRFTEFGR